MAGKIQWMQETILGIQEMNAKDIANIFEKNQNEINEWFKSGEEGSKVYFYINENNELKCDFEAPILYGNCIYFLKNTSKSINTKQGSDDSILMGYLSKKTLIPLLQQTISKVYEPMLLKSEEWNKINDNNTKNKFIKKERQFYELLQTNLQNLEAGILFILFIKKKNQIKYKK